MKYIYVTFITYNLKKIIYNIIRVEENNFIFFKEKIIFHRTFYI